MTVEQKREQLKPYALSQDYFSLMQESKKLLGVILEKEKKLGQQIVVNNQLVRLLQLK